MPSCYSETVRRKVQTDAVDYDPNIVIQNSYEALPNDTYLDSNGNPVSIDYENYVGANNFSHEFVTFDDIYPSISGVSYAGHRIDKIKSMTAEGKNALIA